MNKLIKALLVVACSVVVAAAAAAPSSSSSSNRFGQSVKPLTEAEKAHAAAVYAAEPYYESEAAMAAQECDIDYSTPDCPLDDYTADDAAAARSHVGR